VWGIRGKNRVDSLLFAERKLAVSLSDIEPGRRGLGGILDWVAFPLAKMVTGLSGFEPVEEYVLAVLVWGPAEVDF